MVRKCFNPKNFGQKYFWFKDMFGPRQFCVQKDFDYKKILSQKKIRVQNIFGLNNFVQKCRSKKIKVKKQIFGPKILGPKNF